MTPEQAEWVRENAWTPSMTKLYGEMPGYFTLCHCQAIGSPCKNAGQPRHDICHLGAPLPAPETYIVTRRGGVAGFAEPYTHPSVSATGWRHSNAAMVWLADRVCAWSCPCQDCGHPRGSAHASENHPHRQLPTTPPKPRRPRRRRPPAGAVPLPGFDHLTR